MGHKIKEAPPTKISIPFLAIGLTDDKAPDIITQALSIKADAELIGKSGQSLDQFVRLDSTDAHDTKAEADRGKILADALT